MESEPSKSHANEEMTLLANSLGVIRDSWAMISIAMTDYASQLPAPERDAVMKEVDRLICSLREGSMKNI